ncbi:MAG: acetyl-CoA carboxylase, carboxyltransferase subunit beta [Defluviitaleaceae bacterium]|nr:acetyl-CoA carboxylase, carboxyltransferase subunit beta [Defluviitaleaceae bacterium]
MLNKKANNANNSNATQCANCNQLILNEQLEEIYNVCPSCNYHFKVSARQRIAWICDANSFVEHDTDLTSQNILNFPDYDKKLEKSRQVSSEKEAVICGIGRLSGMPVAIFAMEPSFMMGSMGSVVGEKVTRLFETALEQNLPVVGFIVSGGARMQEGIISLMQMAKTSGAVRRHNDAGNLYLCVLTNPTTGGVTASFAMEADIIVAEPLALIGFAGPRVVEQTTRKQLPDGFQRAEFLLEKGFVDGIVHRKNQREYISQVLKLHQ